jgi:hypothetical protein
MISDPTDEEALLDHLFQFVQDNSPPPTNPPSPPGPGDNEDSETETFHTFNNSNFINNSCSGESSSSSSSTNGDGDVDVDPSYDDHFMSEGSGAEDLLYDEGLIGEDLINEQPDIFNNPFGCLIDSKPNIFEEDFEKDIKHDCMWAGESYGSVKEEVDVKPQIESLSKAVPSKVKFDYSKVKIKPEPTDDESPIHIKEEVLTEDDDEVRILDFLRKKRLPKVCLYCRRGTNLFIFLVKDGLEQ